ncbi:U1 small nuclear ribonucleoprotein 70 kDa [Morella rubra]|uniref:U1 small nuclear ribonucleoprotein 70 kDa n=1 Tax=Morella rubra TaxID=262757 RepID=A0A6A1WNN9_9ROSI|nr:U1 small nuclear ribonucleoprotein 70 kDa [Morella rubra]
MGDYNDAFLRNQPNAAVQGRTKVQNRANVQQLKLIGASHPTGLTSNLLKLFEPRPPLEFKPPPEKRKCPPLSGMAQFVTRFAEPGDAEYAPPIQEAETPVQRRARVHKLRLEKGAEKATEELQKYNPQEDPNISGDPYKTLFVARLSYETTESRIKREFESYGPIKRVGILSIPQGDSYMHFLLLRLLLLALKAVKNIAAVEKNSCFSATLARGDASCDGKLYYLKVRLISDRETNKPRGYAFIEYVHTRDMKAAYKQADGRKIDGRRVLVDVERGRTVPNWRPRRLGGGLGTTRVGGEDVNQRYSGRDQLQSGGTAHSEEPRAREDRLPEREREKSREKGRDREKEREKSHEQSHDRHRDRSLIMIELNQNMKGSGMVKGSETLDLPETEDDRGWYEQPEHGPKHPDQDREPEHYERHRSRGQYDPMDVQDNQDRYDQYPDRGHDHYDRMEDDDYHYERATSESRERERPRDLEREYRRSDRSLSREYEY